MKILGVGVELVVFGFSAIYSFFIPELELLILSCKVYMSEQKVISLILTHKYY